MTTRRSIEPMLWLLFSAGGVLSAMALPMIILLFGVAFPLGWLAPPDHAHMLALLRNPLTRAALVLICMLSLFHWAHRFRYTLYDGLQIKHLDELINAICYGAAIVGTMAAVYVVMRS